MAFDIDIPDRELEHLRERLSPGAFEWVQRWIADQIGNCSDSFRDKQRLPPPPRSEGPSTRFEVIHVTYDSGRRHRIRYVVDDSGAVYGVLQIVFLDCATQ